MFSFRQKIFLSYLGLFAFVILFICPMAAHWMQKISLEPTHERAREIMRHIKDVPHDQIQVPSDETLSFVTEQLTRDFEIGFLWLAVLILLIFSLMTWVVTHYLMQPIHDIIAIIKPYQEGKTQTLPSIELKENNHRNEFYQLAYTLNSLSMKIQKDIDSLTEEKNEKHRLFMMRRDFVANASHELKTPIAVVQGFAEALHDNPTLSVAVTQEITGKIIRNCHRMTTLIKDLLVLSDVENIPLSRLSECCLLTLLQESANIVLESYPKAIITFEVDPSLILVADADLLRLAFVNLIENGAKYSSSPATIIIRGERKENWIEVSIADKGIGIPLADQEYVFDRFYTVDKAHSQRKGGSGLGLAIVKTIIEKHKGTIGLQSTPKEGSTFTVLLPLL